MRYKKDPARRLFDFPERTPCDPVPPTNDSAYGGVGRSKRDMKDCGRAERIRPESADTSVLIISPLQGLDTFYLSHPIIMSPLRG